MLCGNGMATGQEMPCVQQVQNVGPLPELLRPYLSGFRVHGDRTSMRWKQFDLFSAFQPIVSFSHSRVIAHEALLRGKDASSQVVPPLDIFAQANDLEETLRLDRISRLLHVVNAASIAAPGWFFLNLHPALFGSLLESDFEEVFLAIGQFAVMPPEKLVIEIVEEDITDHVRFEEGVALLRRMGVGVALDDFGAGHSNFDRVWKIQPDVVKLDRSFAEGVETDPAIRRLLPQIVSILHEAGTLVLLEGIETLDQARIAMDANIDFGQGWFFGRPHERPQRNALSIKPLMDEVWNQQNLRATSALDARQRSVEPYLQAIWITAQRVALGASLEEAADSYLHLPHVACLYMLDESGLQIGTNLNGPNGAQRHVKLGLGHMEGARWSRRAYFIRAMREPGKAQATRPYLSVATGNICVTVSIMVEAGGRKVVVCGDVDGEFIDVVNGLCSVADDHFRDA